MARTFFYCSAGLLCLMMAYNLGAQDAIAQSKVNCIAGGNGVFATESTFYSHTGEAYRIDGGSPESLAWEHLPNNSLPIAVQDIQILDRGWLSSNAGEVYVLFGGGTGWVLAPPFPGCNPTKADHTSWGGLKSMFK